MFTMSFPKLLLTSILSLRAAAKFVDINVGESGLAFSPNSVTAAVGDVLAFHFFPQNHSVIQGDFNNGCQPASGGFFSGFFAVGSGQGPDIFLVTITSTDPMFFYCGAPGHCPAGMVGAVNPSSGQSLAAYRSAAEAAMSVGIPSSVSGGMVAPASAETSSSAPSSSTSTSQSSPSTSASPSSASGQSSATMTASGSSSAASSSETSSAASVTTGNGTTVTTSSTASTSSVSTVAVSGGRGKYDELQWVHGMSLTYGFQAFAAVVSVVLAAQVWAVAS